MIPLAHLPTLLLLIGYPIYWIELYFLPHPAGHTTWMATILFVVLGGGIVGRKMCSCSTGSLSSFLKDPIGLVAFIFVAPILVIAGMASFLPPHLVQEFDVINYHITIPRQHLILGSFAHIPWATADLFLLPVDFALAPYWLATELPNKWPQFIFFIGLPLIAGSLVKKLGGDISRALLVGLLVLGTHGFAIQAGTGMLDLALCYLLLAALDSFLAGNVVLAGIELAFVIFAKPAFPVLFAAVALGAGFLYLIGRRSEWLKTWSWGFVADELKPMALSWKKFFILFPCFVVLIAGPFMAKGVFYTGTPFYPLGAGIFEPWNEQPASVTAEIDQRGKEHLMVKDNYGSSRGMKDALAHFWLLAVPEKDVNNRFDYPLGLTYLLVLCPFFYFLVRSLRQRNFPLLPVVCVVYWLFWWWGSRQSRFLFIPLGLMLALVSAALMDVSRVLRLCVTVALGLTALSLYRAHSPDFGKTQLQVLRPADLRLLDKEKDITPGRPVELASPDAAFASFAVDVKKEYGFYVLTP